MFGRERNGLENDEIALADRIITLPVNPAFASLNLAQAVAIVAYEYFKLATGGALPFVMPQKSPQAGKQQLAAFFATLEQELERVEFFRPPEKRATMTINLQNIFKRMQPTQQDIQTLHGVVTAMVQGRKGSAKGGILTGDEAEMLRNLLAEHGEHRDRSARADARIIAASAPQSNRCRACVLGCAGERPPLRRYGFKRQIPMVRIFAISSLFRCGW